MPYFCSVGEVLAFISLMALKPPKSIVFALLFFIVLASIEGNPIIEDINPINTYIQPNFQTSETSLLFSLIKKILLIISGNIHPNPGPQSNQSFSIVHINCRSLNKDKKVLIEAECDKFDIMTLSETWFKDIHTDTHTHFEGFHKPIRLDRPDNTGWGGVAVYVKNHHYCKPRPDLLVNGLEAVWVETKICNKSFIVGSFYRPPNARVDYWDLIAESLTNPNNLRVHLQ